MRIQKETRTKEEINIRIYESEFTELSIQLCQPCSGKLQEKALKCKDSQPFIKSNISFSLSLSLSFRGNIIMYECAVDALQL